MLTDPIADFLTRIRNAGHARRKDVSVNSSGIRRAIAQALFEKKFIESYEEEKTPEGKVSRLKIVLRADRDTLELKRVSKPGQRIYVGYKEIKRVRSGLGIGLISTSQGILTDAQAREKKLGGEYICEIY